MKLLSEGYAAIAAESSAMRPAEEESKLASVMAGLDALATEHATAFREQLRVAREVFKPRRGGDDGPARSSAGRDSHGVG
jgi:hypothetical protein